MLGAAAAFIITPAPIDLPRASEESSQLFISIPARGNLPPAMSRPLPCGGMLRLAKVDAAEFARHV